MGTQNQIIRSVNTMNRPFIHQEVPVTIRTLQAVGITAAAFLAGQQAAITYIATPAFLESPPPLLIKQWKKSFEISTGIEGFSALALGGNPIYYPAHEAYQFQTTLEGQFFGRCDHYGCRRGDWRCQGGDDTCLGRQMGHSTPGTSSTCCNSCSECGMGNDLCRRCYWFREDWSDYRRRSTLLSHVSDRGQRMPLSHLDVSDINVLVASL